MSPTPLPRGPPPPPIELETYAEHAAPPRGCEESRAFLTGGFLRPFAGGFPDHHPKHRPRDP